MSNRGRKRGWIFDEDEEGKYVRPLIAIPCLLVVIIILSPIIIFNQIILYVKRGKKYVD